MRMGNKIIPSTATGVNSNTLIIPSIRVDASGQYKCIVSSGNTDVMSEYGMVSVLTLSVITMGNNSNGPVTVAEGGNVMLRCEVTGVRNLNYQWRRVSGSLPRNAKGKNTKTLTIRNIAVRDSGQYYCEVDNEGDSVSSMRVQVIARRRPYVGVRSDNQQLSIVSGNEEVILTCNVNGDDITGGYWERVNDDPLPVSNNRSSLSNDKRTITITISRARPTHSGRYRCVVYSQWGVARSGNVRVTITIAPPMITRQPTNQMITALQDVTFTCKAKGFDVEYEWKHHNGSFTRGRQSSLTISRATPLDEDQYYCVAMTEGGYAFSNNVTLSVNDDIIIRMHPRDITVSEGGTVILNIVASGAGRTLFTYEWKKVGSNSLPDTASGGNSTELTIASITTSDSGLYYCIVMNQWRNMVKSNNATVNVLFIPEILTNPSSVTVLIGQPLQLVCRALGTDVVYQWIKDSAVVSDVSSNMLEITNITESDEGVYKCVASNKGGRVESNPATVTVYGPPVIEELPQQLHVVLGEEFWITCTATNDQDAPMNLMFSWETPNSAHLSLITTDEDDGRTATSTLHISTVTNDYDGVYQCIVRNGKPVSANSSKATTVIVEVQSSPPLTFSITHIDIRSLQLTWNDPENTNGRIDYYTVYYSNSSQSQSKQVVNDVNFNGTYTLDNLRPYTEYSIYVTAVRLIGDTDKLLEGMKSRTVTGRTLGGVPVIDYGNKSRITLNAKNSTLDETFTIDMPAITLQHGLFSYLYIVVVTDNTITNTEDILTATILEESMKSHPLFYVAAVVNVSQYVLGKGLSYTLGAGDNTTDINSQVFYNRKVKDNYFYFFRIFSFDSTPENEVYITSELQKIEIPQLGGPVENTSCQDNSMESNNSSVMAIAILAVLLVVLLICVIVLTVFVFKLKMKLQAVDKSNSVQRPSNAPEPIYEMIAKPDNVNMEKNPAYSVQDTSVDRHPYDVISESNQTKDKQ